MSGRIRSVKPEWLEDEVLALASSDARVLSIALLLVADDHGRGRANKLMLAGQVFPGKPLETLARALEELRRARYVHLYEVEGQSYFAIRNWAKHQRVDKPSAPRVPGPPKETSVEIEIPGDLANVPGDLASFVDILVPDLDPDPDPDLRSGPRSGSKNHVELELDVSLPDLGSFSPEPDELKRAAAARRSEELAVFEAWRVELGHPNARPNPARLARIRSRLREGFTVAQLIQALKNSKNNPFLMGENETNTKYDDLESLLKNGSKVEKLLELSAPPKPRAQLRLDPRNEAQDRNAEHEARADIRTLDRMAQSRRDYELGKRLAAEKAQVASAK